MATFQLYWWMKTSGGGKIQMFLRALFQAQAFTNSYAYQTAIIHVRL